ncbi:MAG: hypothetical protein U0736_06130 [Gemmataceae bacterium]
MAYTDDIHPCYLPDGKIVLLDPLRAHRPVRRIGPPGRHLPVSHERRWQRRRTAVMQPVNEFCPVVLDDRRILYHRWEYIDRGARVSKTLWAMYPDGTKSQELFGLSDDTTPVYMYPQPLPGGGNRVVCVGTCHYPQGSCLGSILLIDFARGVRVPGPDPNEPGFVSADARHPVVNLTPHVFVSRRSEAGWSFRASNGRFVHDQAGRSGHLYTHPFPVSESAFLVSYKVKAADHCQNVPNAYALYLIDTAGRHQRIHADANLSCWHPLPLVARRVPPVVRSPRDAKLAESNQALCVVNDVTEGMEGVRPGQVRWLRVNEAIPRYWSTGRRWNPSLSSSEWKAALWPRVQWGVVPVEKDGSAHFLVPAGRNLFLQALDENFREVQRERSYVNYQPGETRSCTGCHASASRPPARGHITRPIALTRAPSLPEPQPCDRTENGGDGKAGQVIHYPNDIQPILDAKCVSCHGAKAPADGLRLTGEVTTYYNTSYEQLAKKELAGPIIAEFISFLHGDRGNYNGAYLPPGSLGCPTSRLIDLLTRPAHPKNARTDHTRLLTPRELMIVSRWVDTNYQFYGSYFGRQHPRWVERDPNNPAYDPADFRRKASFEEAVGFFAPAWHR